MVANNLSFRHLAGCLAGHWAVSILSVYAHKRRLVATELNSRLSVSKGINRANYLSLVTFLVSPNYISFRLSVLRSRDT